MVSGDQMNSGSVPVEHEKLEKQTRGQGRGSKFFALGHDVWELLWGIETTNRLNLVLTYLVLLAGTGSDHRLTKWSAKACEQYLGIGKPRAKRAIEELISGGLVSMTKAATKLLPQYELPPLPLDAEPVFLPVQLVTGFSGETPVLRRIKETGDPLLLRMLIDLYGLVSLDATFGVPISDLRSGGLGSDQPSARKIASIGAHAVWAIKEGGIKNANGEWVQHHWEGRKGQAEGWDRFWERVALLQQIGALYFEPWLFDSEALDAEPLMPLDPAGLYGVADPDDEGKLTRAAFEVSRALISEERNYLLDNSDADFFVPLPLHQQAPALRMVARLRVEADTPGRRLAWKRRRAIIVQLGETFERLQEDVQAGRLDRPAGVYRRGERA